MQTVTIRELHDFLLAQRSTRGVEICHDTSPPHITFQMKEGERLDEASVVALPHGGVVLSALVDGKMQLVFVEDIKGGYTSLGFALDIWFG